MRVDPTTSILVAGESGDEHLATRWLAEARGRYRVEPAGDEALATMMERCHDAYLVRSMELLREARERGCTAPIIVLASHYDAVADELALKLGADDYLAVDEVTPLLLDRALRYGMERATTRGKLARLAQYDHLTQLPNRALFSARLRRAMSRAERFNDPMALLYLDLDGFKPINDAHGHAAGDEVLREVGRRLAVSVRNLDTVARLGGDEFAVVLERVGAIDNAVMLARRIANAVSAPITTHDNEVTVSTSVGIASFPAADTSQDRLISNADVAMYRAKSSGRNRVQLYTPALRQSGTSSGPSEEQLRKALDNGEFRLVYQPQIDLYTGRAVAAEALLRWHPSEGPPRSPAEFIPALEQMDLIHDVGEWVLRDAARQAVEWQRTGNELRVSVNLSPRQFQDGSLVSRVQRVLSTAGLAPHLLELEITETVLMEDTAVTSEALMALRSMGCRVAIDDFGTGYSSLGYLKRFTADTLKIDKSFIRDAIGMPDAGAIVSAIVSLGRDLQMEVLAEGVETEDELAFVRDRRCHGVQGYLVARPMPPADMTSWLSQHDAWIETHRRLLAQSAPKRAALSPAPLAEQTLLLVEDEPAVRRLLSRQLRRRNLEVIEAANMREARDALSREKHISYVLSDINMPDGKGIDLVDAASGPNAPAFIMMTGNPAIEYTLRAIRGGVVDFLAKPFTSDDLTAALDRARRHRALTGRLSEIEAARERLASDEQRQVA